MKYIIRQESNYCMIHIDEDGKEEIGWFRNNFPFGDKDAWNYYSYDKNPPITEWHTPLEFVEKEVHEEYKLIDGTIKMNHYKLGFWIIEIRDLEDLDKLQQQVHWYKYPIEFTPGIDECPGYPVITIKDGDHCE